MIPDDDNANGISYRRCRDAADANADDTVDLSDAISLLLFLFGGHTLPGPDDVICAE